MFVLVASMFAFFVEVTVLQTEVISTLVIAQLAKRMVFRRLASFVNTRPLPCAMCRVTNSVSTMVPALVAAVFAKIHIEDRT